MKYRIFAALLAGLALVVSQDRVFGASQKSNQSSRQAESSSSRPNFSANERVTEEIRHELAMLPYYSVFDWIEAQRTSGNTLVLLGQVTRPTTKSDAEYRVKKIEGVANVVNQIETLPPSPSDDAIRIAMYRAIFKYDGPLFRYATQARSPIHIIVNNGRVTLKGIVTSEADKQIAYTYARGVPNVFEVINDLQVVKDPA
jgi:hyperosmotically inducible periplasmic protein